VDPDAGEAPKPSAPKTCTSTDEGCPCTKPGATAACGEVLFKSDDYITCSIGTRTCGDDRKWGTCVGMQVITLNSWQANGLRPQGQPNGVPANNTCDPFLFLINGDLTNGGAGGPGTGLELTDAGAVQLTKITGVSGGCTGMQTITISPSASPATDIQITTVAVPPTPNSLQFSAMLPSCAGSVSPVWTVDQPSVATIDSTGKLTLQFPYVGPIKVTAYAGGISAQVTANVTVSATDISKVTNGGPIATQFLSTCGVP
jgi:hypothetical protein